MMNARLFSTKKVASGCRSASSNAVRRAGPVRVSSVFLMGKTDDTSSSSSTISAVFEKVKTAQPITKQAVFTGCYIAVFGLLLTIFPTQIFGLIANAASVPLGWIRVGGVLATLFGFYYLGAAWGDMTGEGTKAFYRATAYGRIYLSAVFSVIVAIGEAPAGLLLLALLNAGGALTTLAKLNQKRSRLGKELD